MQNGKEATSEARRLASTLNSTRNPDQAMVQPNILSSMPLFQGLERQDLDLLADRFHAETFSAGEIIFPQGARADKFYIVISGKVAIRFKPEDGEVINVSEVEAGSVFGWSSALGRKRYTSCAVCLEPTEALSIRGAELREMIEQHPETGVVILERLAEVIAQRLQSTHEKVIDLLRAGIHS